MVKSIWLVVLVMVLTGCGFESVSTGHRGIMTSFGEVLPKVLPEGLNFYAPWYQVTEYSVRQETWSSKTNIFTKDTQSVDVEFSITYYADPSSVTKLFTEFGNEEMLVSKIIKPVSLGSIKDAIGQVIADELVGKREIVTKRALQEVKDNLAARNVFVTDLQFTNLQFDEAYAKAVEDKVVATQEAQKAVNQTVTIKEQAKQTIARATADAEAMKIKSQALAQNKGLVNYEVAIRWDGKLPTTIMGGAVPMLDVKSILK